MTKKLLNQGWGTQVDFGLEYPDFQTDSLFGASPMLAGFETIDEDPYWTMAVVRLACLIEASLVANIEHVGLAMS